MQIWRCAIKVDCSAGFWLVTWPIFPPAPEAEMVHQGWIQNIMSAVDTEWALAAYMLDTLFHQAIHFAYIVRVARKMGDYLMATKTLEEVRKLQVRMDQWRERPIIQLAHEKEAEAQSLDTSAVEPFLLYPPIIILDPFYATLLNAWRALQIYITLILDPTIGHSTCPDRLAYAINICRTLASLGIDKEYTHPTKIRIIFLAQVAFGGQRKNAESMWLSGRLSALADKFPVGRKAFEVYAGLCNVEGDFWEELEKARDILYRS